ncbi:hypothetical protein DFH27DRAFT_537150 [Peziza echinospora]|nr:hypothetical protein DFH27DRAFT_537150 [Peziza echinospora]
MSGLCFMFYMLLYLFSPTTIFYSSMKISILELDDGNGWNGLVYTTVGRSALTIITYLHWY